MIGSGALLDIVADDPAAAWVAPHADPALADPGLLGLGLRDWPNQEYAPHMNARHADQVRANFETAVVEALERLLLERPGLKILPIPFCSHDAGGDDRLLYWRLIQRSEKLRAAADTSLISRELPPAEAMRSMQRCGAFLAMRFHSLVFASALEVPVVSIDYTLGSGKTHSLGKNLGCDVLRIDEVDGHSLHSALDGALQASSTLIPQPTFQFLFSKALAAAGAVPSPQQ